MPSSTDGQQRRRRRRHAKTGTRAAARERAPQRHRMRCLLAQSVEELGLLCAWHADARGDDNRGKEVDHMRGDARDATRGAEAWRPIYEGGRPHATFVRRTLAAAQASVACRRNDGACVRQARVTGLCERDSRQQEAEAAGLQETARSMPPLSLAKSTRECSSMPVVRSAPTARPNASSIAPTIAAYVRT